VILVSEHKALLEELASSILELNGSRAKTLLNDLLGKKVSPLQIADEGISQGMTMVGDRYETGDFYMAEMVLASSIAVGLLDTLRPYIKAGDDESKGSIVIGTVQGDIHDIGKNLVAATLEAGGFQVIDIGVDVPPAKFIASMKQHKPDLVGMSCLITTMEAALVDTIKRVRDDDSLKDVKVMVGGPWLSDAQAERIGADAFGENALQALKLARKLTDRA
jgi:5-methyltetrahydrofolate--homocysteine methyltransferase